jgi:CHAT domain-containing protein
MGDSDAALGILSSKAEAFSRAALLADEGLFGYGDLKIPYSGLFRPLWDFEAMDGETEALRDEAERLSEALRHAPVPDWDGAVEAWDTVASRASLVLGKDDPRTLAARARKARLGLFCEDGFPCSYRYVDDTASVLGDAMGGDSPETLYANETVALCMFAYGEAEGGRTLLADVLDSSFGTLGELHPQTMSARGTLVWTYAVAERRARVFAAAMADPAMPVSGGADPAMPVSEGPATDGPGVAGESEGGLYRPVWDFAPMSEEAEGLRRAAERFSDGNHVEENAVEAWWELTDYAEREYGADDPRTLAARNRLVRQAYYYFGAQEEEAEELSMGLAEAFGNDSAESLYARETAGLGMIADGRKVSGALALLRDVAGESELELGPDHPQTLSARRSLALAAWGAGDRDRESAARAAEELEQVSVAQAAAFGRGHPESLATGRLLAKVLLESGDREAACGAYAWVLRLSELSLPPAAPDVLETRETLARLLAARGDLAAARDLRVRQVEELLKAKGEDDRDTLFARLDLSRVLVDMGELEEARDVVAGMTEAWERTRGDAAIRDLSAWGSLAWLDAALGDADAALAILSGKAEALTRPTRVFRGAFLYGGFPSWYWELYRPAWDFGPMDESDESRRVEADRISDGMRYMHPGDWVARGAWAELAARAEEDYGAGDHRTLAAQSRVARLYLYSDFPEFWLDIEGAAAEEAASAFADALGADSLEALYAAETAALWRLARGDAAGARKLLEDVLDRSSGTLGQRHQQTISARTSLVWADAVAESKERSAAVARETGDRRYRPAWALGPMGERAEGFRRDAEGRSDFEPALARAAWSAVADEAEREFGSGDPRTLAARSRMARLALRERQTVAGRELREGGTPAGHDLPEGGTPLRITLGASELVADAGTLASSLGEALGDDSPEALFARETEGLNKLADGDASVALRILRGVYVMSELKLGQYHPQTLSAGRSLALAAMAADGGPGPAAREARELARISEAQAAAFGPEHPERLATELVLAEALLTSGDMAAARETFAGLMGPLGRRLPSAAPDLVRATLALTRIIIGEGAPAAATDPVSTRSGAPEKANGDADPEAPVAERSIGLPDRLEDVAGDGDTGEGGAGLESLSSEAELLGHETENDSPEALEALARQARARFAAGDSEAALEGFRRVVDARERLAGPDAPETLEALGELARTLLASGDHAGAKDAFDRLGEAVLRNADSEGIGGEEGSEEEEALAAESRQALALFKAGDYVAARDSFRRVLAALELSQGPDHPETLVAKSILAVALDAAGEPAAARDMLAEILDARERVLGPEHPDTLAAKENLAVALGKLGEGAGARDLLAEVLEARARILGQEHPDTLRSMRDLADAQTELGDRTGARDLRERVLEARERTLGPDHPDTLEAMQDLAGELMGLGDPAAALDLMERVRTARELALGPDHPDTLTAANNLAFAQMRLGDNAAARDGFRRVMTAWEDAVGPDHPNALTARTNLAAALTGLGEYAAARVLQERILEAEGRALGQDHPDTLLAAQGLATSMMNLGDYAGARDLLGRIREARERSLGPGHPDTLRTVRHLAVALERLGDHAAARDLLAPSLEVQERILGPDHPNTLETADSLASALMRLGDYASARDLFARVAEARELALGPDHPDTLAALNNLAAALDYLGEYAVARDILARVAEARESALGPDHPDTLKAKGNLAATLEDLGDLAEALALKESVLKTQERALGQDHPDTLTTKLNLAVSLESLGNRAAPRAFLESVLEARARLLGPDHPDTLLAMRNLAVALGNLGVDAEAQDLIARALAAQEAALGPDHPDATASRIILAGALCGSGDPAAARDLLELALDAIDRTEGPVSLNRIEAKLGMAEALSVLGDAEAAVGEARGALETALTGYGPEHPITVRSAFLLGLVLLDSGDAAQAVFFLKTAVDAAQKTRAGLAGLSREERRDWLEKVSGCYRALFRALLAAGRPAEALVALDLIKEDELGGMDPAARRPAGGGGPERGGASGGVLAEAVGAVAGAGNDPFERAGGAVGGAGGAFAVSGDDLFEGTPDGEARRAYLEAVVTDARAGAERAALTERLAGGDRLSGDDMLRLEALNAMTGEARKTFMDFCDSLPGLLGDAAGIPAASAARNLAARQATLREMGAGAVLIHALSAEDALHLVLVTPHTITVRESPAGRAELDAMAVEFRGLLTDPASDPRPAGKRLYDAVIGPLERELAGAGAETLMLSLDWTLRYVPMAALWDGERWLAERWPSAIFTESSVDKLRTPPPEGEIRARALGVTRGWPGFPALSGVAEETAAVVASDGVYGENSGAGEAGGNSDRGGDSEGAVVGTGGQVIGPHGVPGGVGGSDIGPNGVPDDADGPDIGPGGLVVGTDGSHGGSDSASRGVLQGERLLDADFTRGALSASLASRAPVVHVASHFRLDPASHDRTELLLGDGSLLSLSAIERAGDLDFTGVDLLTLSACDTASGTLRGNGREVESFGEVVQRAGASAVLASLWPVSDGATAELMGEFYRLRYLEGMDKARALQGAQLSVMRGDAGMKGLAARGTAISAAGASTAAVSGTEAPYWDGTGYSHPYYWAPFVVMGNWR